jgi:hypothetical protein
MSKLSNPGRALFLCTLALAGLAHGQTPAAMPPSPPGQAAAAVLPATQAPARALQLVAPIALYPDPLVAEILSASTSPAQVAQAAQWRDANPLPPGSDLAAQADAQPWDPSVKALTQFPGVLENMDANLAWTTALGHAYRLDPQGVLDAVQVLRQRAQAAGNLQSTGEQSVAVEGSTLAIEPADPDIVYVPAYDPWTVYGPPIAAYPGWVDVSGVFYPGNDLYFGDALDIGLLAGFGWAWNDWGFDWHARRLVHDRGPGMHGVPRAGPRFGGHDGKGFHDGGVGHEGAARGTLPVGRERPGIGGELHARGGMEEGLPAGGEHLGGEHLGGEHLGGEHLGGGHLGGEHLGGEHLGGEHLGGEHLGGEHIGGEHLGGAHEFGGHLGSVGAGLVAGNFGGGGHGGFGGGGHGGGLGGGGHGGGGGGGGGHGGGGGGHR